MSKPLRLFAPTWGQRRCTLFTAVAFAIALAVYAQYVLHMLFHTPSAWDEATVSTVSHPWLIRSIDEYDHFPLDWRRQCDDVNRSSYATDLHIRRVSKYPLLYVMYRQTSRAGLVDGAIVRSFFMSLSNLHTQIQPPISSARRYKSS